MSGSNNLGGEKLDHLDDLIKAQNILEAVVLEDGGADSQIRLERQMGDAELGRYLISRGEGNGDIFIRLGCHINPSFIERGRVRLVWAIMRLRHPLLASRVCMHDYDDVTFVYELPKNGKVALALTDENLQFTSRSTEDLADSIMNGGRTLSDEHLSYLIINILDLEGPTLGSTESDMVNCDFFFCATHYVTDGIGLHMLANDFFTLLGSDMAYSDLARALEDELIQRVSMKSLPDCVENNLPQSGSGRFQRAARYIDYLRCRRKEIGGHAFRQQAGLPRKSAMQSRVFDPERTKAILKSCKSHGVSVSATLIAVCNFAWERTSNTSPDLPTMIRLLHNLRPYLTNEAAQHDSYSFLAVGYLFVVLPKFVPAPPNLESILWHRSRESKKQIYVASKSPMLESRCRERFHEICQNIQIQARRIDGKLASEENKFITLLDKSEQPPSKELITLSLLGNLDAVYKHAMFPGIHLHSLMGGARQRPRSVAFISYTFAQKLRIMLRYDQGGCDEEMMKRFWENVLHVMDKYLP